MRVGRGRGAGGGGDGAAGLGLLLEPLAEFLLVERDDAEAHHGVRVAAVFGALAPVITRLVGLEVDDVRAIRNHVHLAAELRDPERVDDIEGAQMNADRATRRNHEFVGGDERRLATLSVKRGGLGLFAGGVFILELEPPLKSGGRDFVGILPLGLGHIVGIPDSLQRRDRDEHERKDRRADEPKLNERIAMPLRRRLGVLVVLAAGAELEGRVGQHGADDDEDHERDPARDDEQAQLLAGDRTIHDDGGLVAIHAPEIEFLAAGQDEEAGQRDCGAAAPG